ncbi:MAG: hypothetical protein PHR90_09745, partial [Sphaerochaetaceae bacterium]|nr:hypothetical protein [Sphaerochaetaceae bacterium]
MYLFLLPLMADSGQVLFVSDIPGTAGGPTDTEVLQYDDGTYQWLAWQGVYRGIWFNPEDFYPGNPGFLLETMEWWLYENPANPWNTSGIYASIWLGDQNGPQVLLDSRLITGGYTYYDPPLPIEGQFWGIVN